MYNYKRMSVSLALFLSSFLFSLAVSLPGKSCLGWMGWRENKRVEGGEILLAASINNVIRGTAKSRDDIVERQTEAKEKDSIR